MFFVLFLLAVDNTLLTVKFSSLAKGQVESAQAAKNVELSAQVGAAQRCNLNLFGYSSPRALVTLEGVGIYGQVYADNSGYFEFKNYCMPISSTEACLSSQDQFGRNSNPTCLPPFPANQSNIVIGPIILAPTLSFEKPDYFMGDEIVLSGQTIPNSEVDLSVFTKDRFEALNTKSEAPNKFEFRNLRFIWDLGFRISNFNLIEPVEAFTFPALSAKTDKYGNFSLSLPSSNPQTFRLFAQTNYLKSPSAKSNMLNLNILPWWMIIVKIFAFLFALIRPRLIEIVIALQLIILAGYIIRRYFTFHTIARNRALTVRNNLALRIK